MSIQDISQFSPELRNAAELVLPSPNALPAEGQTALSTASAAPSATAPPASLPLTPNALSSGLTTLAAPSKNLSFADKIRQAADKLGIPPGPGGWAKSLIGAAQSVGSTTLGDIQTANESLQKSNPYGGAGVLGVLGAQQNARNARQQAAKVAQTTEDRERGQIAYANAQTLLQEQTLHRLQGETAEKANDQAIQNGVSSYKMAVETPAAFGLEPGKVIAGGGGTSADISESELQKALTDGTWDPTKEQYAATSKIPSMDGNKPRLDSSGNPMYEKRYTIYTTPPTIKLSKDNADFLNANLPGSDWKEDQEMPGAVGLMLFQNASNAHAAAAARASDLEAADIKLESLEHTKATDASTRVLDADPDYQKARAHIHGLENLAMYVTGQAPTGRVVPEMGPDGKPTGRTVPEMDPQSVKYAKDHPNALVDIRNSYGFDKKTGESIFDKTLQDQQEKEALAREKKNAELPKTLEDATAQYIAALQSGDPVKVKNAAQQRDAAYKDKTDQSANQARQDAQASGKDVEAMVKTGINPITKERLNLLNAPDAALVDRHGLPVPTDMVSLYKPTSTEKTTADTARQVLAITGDLRKEIAVHPELIGPLMGRDQKGISKLGYSSTEAQNMLNNISLLQSAATKMHTSRFSNEILNKMGGMIDAHMSPQAFTGGLNSIDSVANRYALEDQLITAAQYNQLARQQEVPAGQSLIQDSRGHYQTIPTTVLDKAKQMDPKLQVIK